MPRRCELGCPYSTKLCHRFPHPFRNPERFKIWVRIAGGKLNSKDDYELYRKKVVCDIHFTDKDRNRNNRLNCLAVPSLHLPGGSNAVDTSDNGIVAPETRREGSRQTVTGTIPVADTHRSPEVSTSRNRLLGPEPSNEASSQAVAGEVDQVDNLSSSSSSSSFNFPTLFKHIAVDNVRASLKEGIRRRVTGEVDQVDNLSSSSSSSSFNFPTLFKHIAVDNVRASLKEGIRRRVTGKTPVVDTHRSSEVRTSGNRLLGPEPSNEGSSQAVAGESHDVDIISLSSKSSGYDPTEFETYMTENFLLASWDKGRSQIGTGGSNAVDTSSNGLVAPEPRREGSRQTVTERNARTSQWVEKNVHWRRIDKHLNSSWPEARRAKKICRDFCQRVANDEKRYRDEVAKIPIEKFDFKGDTATAGVRWARWKRAFLGHLDATGITRSENKMASLFKIGGSELQEIYNNIPETSAPDGLNVFQAAIDKLDTYFTPKNNTSYQQHIFRSLKQEHNEPFEKFLDRLRQQANKCLFQDKNNQIIGQITDKCLFKELRTKILLFGGTMTLNDITREAKLLEEAKRQVKYLKSQMGIRREMVRRKIERKRPRNKNPLKRS